jgi:UDPglucose 6-dehydrogenase
LSRIGAHVVAYDPLANEMARVELCDQVIIADSINDCLAQAEVVLITTPDPAFRMLKVADLNNQKSYVTVVDFWRILDHELAGKTNIRYIPIGRSTDDITNATRIAELWNIGDEPSDTSTSDSTKK